MTKILMQQHFNAAPNRVFALLTDHVGFGRALGEDIRLERQGVPAPNGLGAVRAIHARGPPLKDVSARIRIATATDAPAVLEIYAPFVRTTAVTFEYEVPSVAEMADRIRTVTVRWPWLVCDRDGAVAGYAYASTWRARAA